MKIIPIVLLLTLISSVGVSKDKIADKLIKSYEDVGVLVSDGEPYCSAVKSKDKSNNVYVFTAAHCCYNDDSKQFEKNVQFIFQTPNGAQTVNINDINSDNLDHNGQDICRLTSEQPLKANSKIGIRDVYTDTDTKAFKHEKLVLMLTKFPLYCPSGWKEPPCMQSGYMIGPGEDESNEVYVVLEKTKGARPGMSGSPVYSITSGTLIGIVSQYVYPEPYNNTMIMSIFELTEYINDAADQ